MNWPLAYPRLLGSRLLADSQQPAETRGRRPPKRAVDVWLLSNPLQVSQIRTFLIKIVEYQTCWHS